MGLIRFLALTGQKGQAETMLAEAVRKIPGDKAPRALAPCYEMLGRADEAAAQYERSWTAAATTRSSCGKLLNFVCGRTSPCRPKRICKRSSPPRSPPIHRTSPGAAGHGRHSPRGGGYANLLQAVKLVNQNLTAATAAEDLLEKALLLAAFPQRAKRQEAIEALEKVVGLQKTETADARFVLAHLYLRENDWPRSRKQMLALLAGHGKNPRYVAAYVAMLFERDEMVEAGVWLERLEALTPGNPANLVFRVEMFVRRQQIDQAIQLLLEKAGSGEQGAGGREQGLLQAVLCLKVSAARAGRRGDHAAKERLLAEMDNLVTDSVRTHPRLQFLRASVRLLQGRTDEALTLAEKSWPNTETQLLATEFAEWAGGELHPGTGSSFGSPSAGRGRNTGPPTGDPAGPGQSPHAVSSPKCRGSLSGDSHAHAEDLAAMNNLALILALQELDIEESLKLINRAIAIAGPLATFLDTRAAALLASGQPQEALADLNEVIRDDPRPNRYFHQALAFWQLGQKKAANDAFLEAGNRGLKPEDLVERERAKYEELTRNLSQ